MTPTFFVGDLTSELLVKAVSPCFLKARRSTATETIKMSPTVP